MLNNKHKKWLCYLLVFVFLLATFSCAVHNRFPFICFEAGCIKNQFSIGGIKKRIRGKVVVMKRKMNKKDLAVSKSKVTKQGFFDDRVGNKDSPDSTRVIKGTNVDYTRFTLLFKLRSETKPFDSIDVVHTSQYRTIIETDQARLNHKLDTLISNVLMVFIRESHNSSEYVSVIKRRNNAIKKYLRHAGIAQHRIKIISRVE